MKKILRYFPSRKIALILILFLIIALTMKQGYCLSYTNVGTQAFNEELEDKLEEQYVFDNYLYFFNSTTPISNGTNLTICLFYNNIEYKRADTLNAQIKYTRKIGNNISYQDLKCLRTSIQNMNNEKGLNRFTGLGTATYGTSSASYTIYSSIQLTSNGTENGTITVAKNIDYTKPTCPVCEECTECASGGEEGECGPVEITNFPIDKNEFYVLLLILSTLVFMLFFKWCFPMKGGKK